MTRIEGGMTTLHVSIIALMKELIWISNLSTTMWQKIISNTQPFEIWFSDSYIVIFLGGIKYGSRKKIGDILPGLRYTSDWK